MNLEVLSERPQVAGNRAPLLFVRVDEDDAFDRRVFVLVSHVHAYGLEMVGSEYVPDAK